MDNEKSHLLDALLPLVPFDGWTDATLKEAAQKLGIDDFTAYRIFPGGISEAIDYFIARADQRMADALSVMPAEPSMTKRVRRAILLRLHQHIAHREAVRRALAYYALPVHVARGLKSLYRTVDEIWYQCGEHSVDFSFYTKRLTLAGIYSSTLLYWLNDDSEDQKDTEAFLDRRLNDLKRFHESKQKVKRWFGMPNLHKAFRP